MKRTLAIIGVLLLAGLAIAGPTVQRDRFAFLGGIAIGNDTAVNRLDNTVTADVDYDFPNTTIVCNDSWAVTATGARIGDTCSVSIGPRDGGTQIVTDNSLFLPYVSASNTVKLRHCPVGTAADPVDAGYVVRCFSSP